MLDCPFLRLVVFDVKAKKGKKNKTAIVILGIKPHILDDVQEELGFIPRLQ